MGKSSGANPLTTMANKLHSGNLTVLAEEINTFFCSITEHLDPLVEMDFGKVDIPSKYTISVEDVERSLSTINVRKATGPDGIPNWVLRDFASILGPPVCAIWNNTIRSGYIPNI